MLTVARVAIGFVAFLAAHFYERATWTGPSDPWFLNSARGAAITGVVVFGAALIVALRSDSDPRTMLRCGASVAAGACAAMAIALFTIGPGTIFPIVLVIGAAFLTTVALAGATVGWLARSGANRR